MSVLLKKKTNTYQTMVLKKHVGTIHCSNTLSLLQRKIANALLFKAYPHLKHENEFHIHLKELGHLIGYNSHDYALIKKALIELISTVIEWNVIEKGGGEIQEEWNASAMIADARIKGSHCTYSYSHRMKELLYMPSIYGRLNMQIQSKFKSSYGLALYENTIRYQGLPSTPWISFHIFRKLMGVPQNKYIIFRDFNKRVLSKAVEEVNLYSPILVIPEFRKEERKMIAIRFLMKENPNYSKENVLQEMDKREANEESIKKLLSEELRLTPLFIRKIFSEYSLEMIQWTLKNLLMSKPYHSQEIHHMDSYFLALLKLEKSKHDHPNSSESTINIYQSSKSEHKKQAEEITLKKERLTEKREEFLIQFEKLPEKDFILKQFKKHLKDVGDLLTEKYYEKSGYKHIGVLFQLRTFVEHYYPKVFDVKERME